MPKQRVTKRLLTVVSIDVAGYTRLMEADEAGTLAALKAHRGITDAKIYEFGGRIVSTAGDGLLAEFSSVNDAVSCAIGIQTLMANRNVDVPTDRRIEFRIGINLGDVIVEDDDIFGTGVNVAARLQELAEPGSIWVSHSVYSQVRSLTEIGFADLGPQKVKNIAEPVTAYKVLMDPADAGKLVMASRMRARRNRWLVPSAAATLIVVGLAVAWWRPWETDVAPASVNRMALTAAEQAVDRRNALRKYRGRQTFRSPRGGDRSRHQLRSLEAQRVVRYFPKCDQAF